MEAAGQGPGPEPLVIVCHCHAISDRVVRRAVRQGAATRRQVARACRAGSGCGGCRATIQSILDDEHRSSERPVSAALGDLAPSH